MCVWKHRILGDSGIFFWLLTLRPFPKTVCSFILIPSLSSRASSRYVFPSKNDVPDPSDCKKGLVSDEEEEGEEGKDRENGKIGKKTSRKIGACWEYGIESSFAVASKRYPGEIRRGEIKERRLKHIVDTAREMIR